MKHLKLIFACLLTAILSIGQVWADDATTTEDFELQTAGSTYNSQQNYAASASNAEIAWYVEHGTVSTNSKLSGDKSLQMRGYYAKNSAASAWNGALPYLESKTAVTGLKSISLKIAAAATFKIDFMYCEEGSSTWNAMKTNEETPADATNLSFTTTASTVTYNIPSSDPSKGYFIKILANSSSTHTANPSGSGNIVIRVDDIVFTYPAPETPTCAKPTFSPAAGSYEGTQNVTISSTADATIYYTTDDTDPTTSGTRQTYSSPIAVSADMTIKAYAVKAGYDDSEVAEAAYTITEGPDVTINLLDDGWGFPTSKVVDETSYTNGDYTIKVAGTTGNGFRTYGTYFLLGQSGAYIELPEFANPIEKIVVSGNSGGSGTVTWNIFKGDDAVSTAATGCKSDAYTFNIDPVEANAVYRIKVTSAANLQIKTIKIFFGAAPAVAKPTISGNVYFATSTSVTISHADADHIYYTTNGDDPTTSSAEYSAPFSLTNTATVKAIAVKGSDVSEVAVKAFTKVTPKTTAAELRAFATSSNQNAFIQLDGWKVTFVNGNNAYLVDPSNEGVILNNAGHGYKAGDELNDEVVEATIKLSSGRVQLTGFTSSNITATAGSVSPAEIADYSTLTSAHQSRLVTLKNATYASSAGTFSDGANVINFYDQFSASPTLVDGATYDVTGIFIYYDNGTTQKLQIAPRTAADVVATSAVTIPTSANLAELKAKARGANIVTLTNAVITYVNGNNAFIEEGTTGALIYSSGHGYSAGDCLNGDYQVTTEDHNGKFEITAIDPQAGAATSTATTIPLTTVNIATLNANFASYESRRIKIEGATVTDAISGDDRDGAISDGEALAVYASVKNTISLNADAAVNIIGYPGFYNTNQQLTVWRQEDIEDVTPPVVLTDYYEKVTSTANIAEGTYLIVYEAGNLAFNGGLETLDAKNNVIDVEITNDNKIGVTTATEAATFYIEPAAGTIQAANGKYIGVTSNSNGLKQSDNADAYENAFAIDADGNAVISAVFENANMTMRYNKASDQNRFRYFGSGQQPIALYKLANEVLKQDPGISWDPESAELTLNDYLTPADYPEPGLIILADFGDNNPLDFITLSSDNESLATINKTNDGQINISWVPDVTGTVHFTATFAGNETYKPATAVCTVTIKPANSIYVAPSLNVNFGTVAKDATVDDKVITVTLTGVDAASVALAGDGASAFSFTPDALTASGDITISASSATAGTFNATLTISDDASQAEAKVVHLSLTVTEPEIVDDLTGTWVLATAVPGIGEKFIVAGTYNSVTKTMGVQNANNRAAVESSLSEGVLTPGEGTKVFTLVDAGEGKFAIQASNGKYLSAAGTGTNNYLREAANYEAANAQWTISISEGIASVVASSSNRNDLQYNKSNPGLFSCYATNGQTAIQLFVQQSVTPPTPAYVDVRTGLTAGNYYSVCWPKAMTAIKGATLWSFAGKDASMAYIVQEEAPFVAGRPYIIYATADKLEAVVEGDDADAGSNNGLYGTLDYMDADALSSAGATHMLKSNELRPIGTNNHLDANRAYVKLSEIPEGAPSQMPGREVRKMPMQGTESQGVDNLNASETPVKMMINGQLFIIRGEKMYDATGRLVK